jgi:hypothetical protein
MISAPAFRRGELMRTQASTDAMLPGNVETTSSYFDLTGVVQHDSVALPVNGILAWNALGEPRLQPAGRAGPGIRADQSEPIDLMHRGSASMLVDRAHKLLTMAADGNTAGDPVRQAAQDFIDAFRGADAGDVAAALGILGQAYALPHTDHLPLVLAVAGSLVEQGADATPLVAPVVEFLQHVTPLAVDFHDACVAQLPVDADDQDDGDDGDGDDGNDAEDGDDPDAAFRAIVGRLHAEMPEAAVAWRALEARYVPVIAVLAASPSARAQSRSLALSMEHLREYNGGASWLAPMLMVLDGEPILVVEPDTGLGLVGRMSGVSDNFQLHVLLMDVFPRSDSRSGPRISPKAADIVRGNVAEQQDDAPITGHWNLHAWTALQAAGRLAHDHDPSSTSHWIWNEGVPADIPAFDGHRIVVLGPPSYRRSFFAQRDFRGLRAEIDVERLLSPDEVAAWVARFSQSGPDGRKDDAR